LAAAGLAGFVYFAPETATRLAVDLRRAEAGLVRKSITLPSGETYVYLEGGSGPAMLLLHGFGANKDNFTLVAKYLTPRYHVIAPDHIGFGESDRPAGADYTPPAQAVRLRGLVQALGLSKIHIGGSSMGGHIAMTYAALWPDEVESMWLLDPGGVWSAPESEMRGIIRETGKNPLIAKTPEEFVKIFEFVMTDPPFIPTPILHVMARERVENVALEEKIFAQLTSDSIEQRVKGLAVPALIVWGDRDRAIRVETAEILRGLLPNAEVVIMKGIGHLPMLEAPRWAAGDYLAFLSGLDGPQQ
ncbi:MAG: alpha/beta fold hydrolase, partial [Thermodesulfobacteriota bacterium]